MPDCMMDCPTCDGTGQIERGRFHVGLIIATAREKTGMTQKELAQKVKISRGSVANIEVGRQALVSEMIRPFADALGIDPMGLVP